MPPGGIYTLHIYAIPCVLTLHERFWPRSVSDSFPGLKKKKEKRKKKREREGEKSETYGNVCWKWTAFSELRDGWSRDAKGGRGEQTWRDAVESVSEPRRHEEHGGGAGALTAEWIVLLQSCSSTVAFWTLSL